MVDSFNKQLNIILLMFICIFSCYGQDSESFLFQTKDKTQEILFHESYFEYYYKLGMWQYACSEGTWHKEKNKIILNSTYKNLNNIPLRVYESQIDSPNITFNLKLDTFLSSSLSNSLIYKMVLDNKDTVNFENNKVTVSKIPDVFNVQIIYNDSSFIPKAFSTYIKSMKYLVKDSTTNNFDIIMPITINAFYYFPILNDTLTKRRNKIIWKTKPISNTFINEKNIFKKEPISEANLINTDQCRCKIIVDSIRR